MNTMIDIRRFLLFGAATFALLAVAACVNVNEELPNQGEVSFGVEAAYQADVETRSDEAGVSFPEVTEEFIATRTEYSGVDQDGNEVNSSSTYERINWLATDGIEILCQQADGNKTANFGVTPGYASGNETNATIEPWDHKLYWSNGTHYFFGLYPSPMMDGCPSGTSIATSGSEGKAVTIHGTIPAIQTVTVSGTELKPNMAYAYMYAAATASSGNVKLHFKPLVTTLRFTLKSQTSFPAGLTLTKIELSSEQTGSYLTGNFTATVTNNGLTPLTTSNITGGSNNITITVPGNGVALSTTDLLMFTILTLPMDQTKLKLTLTFSDGSTKSLNLKSNGSDITVGACKKCYINDAGLPWVYYLGASTSMNVEFTGGDDTYKVNSYKYISEGGTKVAVKWKVKQYEVSTDGGATWGTPTTTKPAFFTTFTTTGNGTTGTAATYNATIAPSDRLVNDELNTKPVVGSSGSPINLAMVSPGTTNAISSESTSNCYVVSAPGYYRFPVKYGNNTDKAANFVNHLGNRIGTGWIHGQTNVSLSSASLVWEDSPHLVKDIALSSDKHYISFFVDKQTIAQGNAVIAVYDSNNKIAWSWHIWVTHHSMTSVKVRNKQFMEVNLGWCDAETVQFPNRQVKVTFVQTEPVTNPKTKAIIFKQQPYSFSTTGNGPHYAWGRKDPMLPPLGDPNQTGIKANKIWYNKDGVASQEVTLASGTTMAIKDVIQNPFIVILGAYNWQPNNYYNLWNYNIPNNSTVPNYKSNPSGHSPRFPMYEQFGHGKTVYDPCPAGYTVAAPGDFIYFETQNSTMIFYAQWGADQQSPYGTSVNNNYTRTWNRGVLVKAQSGVTTADNFWPADGMREYSSAAPDKPYVNSVGKIGYYYTSSPFYQPEKSPAWEYAMIMMCADDYGNGGVAGSGKPGFMASRGYSRTSCRSIRCVPE